MALPSTSLVALLALCISYALHYMWRRRAGLPPGPLGLPFVGNLLDMPAILNPDALARWSHKYGDVVCLKTFASTFVIVNSANAALQLLEKRGALYSDRPQQPMACDLVGIDRIVILTPIGERFKRERKLMNSVLNPRAVANWEPLMVEQARTMLQDFLAAPQQFSKHMRRYTTGLVFGTVYGYKITTEDDTYLRIAQDFMKISAQAITGIWAVDLLPFLRWIPALPFHRTAALWRKKIPEWVDYPHEMMREYMKKSPDSFCGALLYPSDGGSADAETEELVKWIATSIFGAGSDTPVAILEYFVYAMVVNPRAQEKVVQEIEAVVGRQRLPTFSDRTRLPYMECIYKECLRWSSVSPLTPPHRLTEDDTYEGYTLPKGATVLCNVRSILRDEELFPDAHSFVPERYEADVSPELARLMDPDTWVFGFGRRRCPGVPFATASVWLAMVSIVACFRIERVRDAKGREIIPERRFTNGAIQHLTPFPCRIVARHDGVEKLLG